MSKGWSIRCYVPELERWHRPDWTMYFADCTSVDDLGLDIALTKVATMCPLDPRPHVYKLVHTSGQTIIL